MADNECTPEIISQEEARTRGLKYFFTGHPCKRGHLCERRVVGGDCVKCSRVRQGRNENPEPRTANRKLALAAGDLTYEGSVCVKDTKHGAIRYTNNGQCVQCMKILGAIRYAPKAHPRELLPQEEAKRRKLARQKAWRDRNKERVADYDNQYKADQRKTNPQYILRHAIRTRLNIAVRRGTKGGSAVRDLGCTIEEFVAYIEAQFRDGMSWDNWGEWHLDHVLELALFDLTDREQFLKAVHYTNYQPLWEAENLAKRPELGRGKLGATQRSIREKVQLPADDLFAGLAENPQPLKG